MAYTELLTQSADLQRATITRSTTGEEVESWATVFESTPVLARPLSPKVDIPIGLSEAVTHLFHMGINKSVLTGRWRFVLDGSAYRIVSVTNPGNRNHHFEVLARRLEEGL